MSIELIVFESPEEEKQTLTESEIQDEQLYQIGLRTSIIEDLRSLESVPPEYTRSDIADIAFSQVVEYSIPFVTDVKEEEVKKKYYLTITMPARLKVIVQSKKKYAMFVSEGKAVNITGARFLIHKQGEITNTIKPVIPNSTHFTSEKQVLALSKNIWNIVSGFRQLSNAGIARLQKKPPPLPHLEEIVPRRAVPRDPTPVEKILRIPNTFQFETQYIQHLFLRNLYDQYAIIRIFGEKSEQAAEIKQDIEAIRENEECQRRHNKDMWHKSILLAARNSEAQKRFRKPYSLLNPKERDSIDAALKKHWAQPILPLLSQLRSAIQTGEVTKSMVKELQGIMSEDKLLKATAYINEICPHEIYLGILYSKTYKNPIERDEIISKKLKESFAEVELLGEVSCRICSEIFEDNKGIEYGVFNRLTNVQADEYDKLYKTIWEEMIMAVSRYVVIEKSYKLKIGKIIETSAAMIRNEIGTIQHEIMKNKTATAFQIEKTIDVYIYIYIFAVLTQLIFMNEHEMQFASTSAVVYSRAKKGAREATLNQKIHQKIQTGQPRLQELINRALSFVRIIKGPEIESSSYITMDTLKNAFVKAYKWVYSLNYVQSDSDSASKRRWEECETPYTLYFTRYDPKALGRSREEILKEIETKNVYETLKLPHDSLKSTHFYLTEKVYRDTIIPISQQQQKYENMLMLERSKDQKVRISNCIKFHLISSKIRDVADRKRMVIPVDAEERCRCSTRTYIFEKSGKKQEFTPEMVHDMIQKNSKELADFYSMKYVGEKCKGCRNQKYIDSSLESLFWDYFTNACPESDFHEYSDAGECTKCKINRIKLEGRDSAYFNKYKKMFQDKRKAALQEVYDALAGFAKKPARLSQPKTSIRLTDSRIHKLVKEHGVSYNIYRNIGLIYNMPYEKVQKGTIDPSSTATDDQLRNRNNKLIAYFAEMMVAYNQVKYSEYNISPSPEVAKILENINNKGFHSKVPRLDDHVLRTYRAAQLTPKDGSLYLLNEIAGFILDVKKKIPGAAGERLALHYVSFILNSERMTSEYTVKGLSNDAETPEEKTQGLDADETIEEDEDDAESVVNPGLDAEFSELANDQLDMEIDADLDMDENLLVSY